MREARLSLLLVLIAATSIGQELSPTDAYVQAHHQYYEDWQKKLAEKLVELDAELKPLRDAKIDRRAVETNTTTGEGESAISWFADEDGTVYFKTAKEKREAIEKFAKLHIEPRKKELDELPARYESVRLLISFSNNYPGEFPPNLEVFQVIDDDEALIKTPKLSVLTYQGIPNGTIMYFKGIKTEGMVDGETVKLAGAFYCTGTTTYKSAGGGTNTVRVVEPFDTTEADKIIKAKAVEHRSSLATAREATSAAEEKALAKKRESLTREFTDTTGTFKIKAQFVEYTSGNVRLKKENGEIISVPLTKLSAADRRWVAEQQK